MNHIESELRSGPKQNWGKSTAWSASLKFGASAKQWKPAPRLDHLSNAAPSPLYDPLHHRCPSSKSFLKVTHSRWHVVLIWWFHHWPGFSPGANAHRAPMADLGSANWSGVSKQQKIKTGCLPPLSPPQMWVQSDMWQAVVPFVSRTCSVWVHADQLLRSIWWYFLWLVPDCCTGLSGPRVTFSAALYGPLLLRMMWAVLSKCTWADGFECVCLFFFSAIIFPWRFSSLFVDAALAVPTLKSWFSKNEDLFHSAWMWLKVGKTLYIFKSHVVTFNFIVFVSASASNLFCNDSGEMIFFFSYAKHFNRLEQ